jgi:hypothetical protein
MPRREKFPLCTHRFWRCHRDTRLLRSNCRPIVHWFLKILRHKVSTPSRPTATGTAAGVEGKSKVGAEKSFIAFLFMSRVCMA